MKLALVALEGFLASCGSEMRVYTEETIAAALRFLKYDPNYNDDDDEEMSGTQPDEDEMERVLGEDDDSEADAGFDDDDDDASWKVRRCAAKTLYTLISTHGSGDLLRMEHYMRKLPQCSCRDSMSEKKFCIWKLSQPCLLLFERLEKVC